MSNKHSHKLLSNIDISSNDILNVAKIQGPSYDNVSRDLDISASDSSEGTAGNLTIHAGDKSKVDIYTGSSTAKTVSISLDSTKKRASFTTDNIVLKAEKDFQLTAATNNTVKIGSSANSKAVSIAVQDVEATCTNLDVTTTEQKNEVAKTGYLLGAGLAAGSSSEVTPNNYSLYAKATLKESEVRADKVNIDNQLTIKNKIGFTDDEDNKDTLGRVATNTTTGVTAEFDKFNLKFKSDGTNVLTIDTSLSAAKKRILSIDEANTSSNLNVEKKATFDANVDFERMDDGSTTTVAADVDYIKIGKGTTLKKSAVIPVLDAKLASSTIVVNGKTTNTFNGDVSSTTEATVIDKTKASNIYSNKIELIVPSAAAASASKLTNKPSVDSKLYIAADNGVAGNSLVKADSLEAVKNLSATSSTAKLKVATDDTGALIKAAVDNTKLEIRDTATTQDVSGIATLLSLENVLKTGDLKLYAGKSVTTTSQLTDIATSYKLSIEASDKTSSIKSGSLTTEAAVNVGTNVDFGSANISHKIMSSGSSSIRVISPTVNIGPVDSNFPLVVNSNGAQIAKSTNITTTNLDVDGAADISGTSLTISAPTSITGSFTASNKDINFGTTGGDVAVVGSTLNVDSDTTTISGDLTLDKSNGSLTAENLATILIKSNTDKLTISSSASANSQVKANDIIAVSSLTAAGGTAKLAVSNDQVVLGAGTAKDEVTVADNNIALKATAFTLNNNSAASSGVLKLNSSSNSSSVTATTVNSIDSNVSDNLYIGGSNGIRIYWDESTKSMVFATAGTI